MWGHLGAHAPSPPPPPSHSYAPRCRSSLSSCFLAMNVIRNWEWPWMWSETENDQNTFPPYSSGKMVCFFVFFHCLIFGLQERYNVCIPDYWNILKINNYRTDDHTLRNWKQLVLLKNYFFIEILSVTLQIWTCEEKKYIICKWRLANSCGFVHNNK